MRPGCINICAGMGGDRQATLAFMSETWILAPTPDMRIYETTPEQLKFLVKKVEKTYIEGNQK